MNIKEFAYLCESKRQEIDTLLSYRMPATVGRIAKDHFQENFRKGGFVNGGLHPWQESIRRSLGGASADYHHGTLLSGDKHLFNSINYYPGNGRVRIATSLVYASIHNWGGTIQRTDRMRRYAWYRFFQASGSSKSSAKPKGAGTQAVSLNPEASFWKGMALSRKRTIRMPQRQFLGESRELTEVLCAKIEKEIRKIINQ